MKAMKADSIAMVLALLLNPESRDFLRSNEPQAFVQARRALFRTGRFMACFDCHDGFLRGLRGPHDLTCVTCRGMGVLQADGTPVQMEAPVSPVLIIETTGEAVNETAAGG